VQEDDPAHGMTKFNPLADWSEAEVWEYIRANKVPYNALHDRGYPSIGCEPCTRAIGRARTCAPDAGGGKTPSRRNAACTWSTANLFASNPWPLEPQESTRQLMTNL
jgi:3'-phosphoadenosine 5'-phosphosulfate sulfotransferase (PAPS reductase)/FAD synthetase